MNAITTPAQGIGALQAFLLNRPVETPEDVREKLVGYIDPSTMASPVEAASNAAELIYARREDLAPELLEIGAQLATMLASFKLFGFQVDDRGYAMTATIRAMPGVAVEPPAPETLEAPEAKKEFLPQPEVQLALTPAELAAATTEPALDIKG